MPRPSLSLVCRTAAAGPRPAAILATLRDVADEIVVAVDDRSDPAARGDLVAVADRMLLYPFAEPVDRVLPWLFSQCRTDWVFVLDDDEVPSLDLIAALRNLLHDASVAQYWLEIRWLHPDPTTYLAEWPWQPHYAARLLRPDPTLVRFSNETHKPIVTSGPGRFLPLALWHADSLLRPFDVRLAKAARYERERPGMRIAGRALNHAFYLPELRTDARLEAVPAAERERIEAILNAGSTSGVPRAAIETVSRDEIDHYWPVSDAAAQAGELRLVNPPSALVTGEERTIDALVRNTGTAAWPWGTGAPPELQVGTRWYGLDGADVAGAEIHTPLPLSMAPGEDCLVPVHVRAPERPGPYRLAFDLIQQHVRWFEAGVDCEVDVRPRRQIAVLGDDDAVADVAGVLAALPEVEIVRLRRSPSARPGGYREAPDHRAYLLDGAPSWGPGFAATLLCRRLRLRLGPSPPRAEATVAALREAELLVVAGPEGPDERRERFARAALMRTARSLGVPVAATRDPDELARLLRRAPCT